MFIYTSHHSISSIISKPQKSHHKVYTVPNSTQTCIPIESYTSLNFPEKSQNRNFTHRTPYAYHMTHTRPYAYHLASYAYHTHFTRTQNGLETNPYAYQLVIRVSPELISSFQNSIRVSALPYAYHQNNFPL